MDGLSTDKSYESALDKILNSVATTAYLGQEPRAYLTILDQPVYSDYNIPIWVRRHAQCGPDGFTIKKLFEAMYKAATEVGLSDGLRYAYAATCTCPALARQDENLTQERREERLAQELSRLATLWLAYMLWPCEWSAYNITSQSLIISLPDPFAQAKRILLT